MSGNNIKVVCRFRPQNKRELAEGGVPIVEVDDTGTVVRIDNNNDIKQDFAFDRIFPMGTRQVEIFEYGIRDTVDDVFNGYNGTVFAYGQTGAGKTFSMMGELEDDELKGIIPRIVETIFQSIHTSPPTMEYTVKVAYMEIYMEKIRDLLNPINDNLPVHEDKVRGVYVKGMVEVYVSSIEEVYEVLQRGSSARIVAFTNMNAESSRSHSIFQITIGQKNLNDGSIKSGRLYLVDLAGSEKVGKTGASGQTLEEAKKINKSLSALGMVINSLTDGKSKHIPYRDSKLTRILQESLGGNSRTTLIINCSPSSFNDFETLSTLRFGMRAKSIKNKAKVNADLSPAELKAMLKKAKAEAITFQQYIAALEGEVSIWRSGGTVKRDDQVSMEKIAGGKMLALSPVMEASEIAPESVEPVAAEPASVLSRSSSPTPVLDKDEREDFLKRENELMDQIAEKESELTASHKLVESLREELSIWKQDGKQLKVENESMSAQLSDLKLHLEKVMYDSKEAAITLDSLSEANRELSREIEVLRKELTTLRQSHRDSAEADKAQKKSDMMAKMMAELSAGTITEKEKAIRNTLQTLETIEGAGVLSNAEATTLRHEVAEMRSLTELQEQSIAELTRENDALMRKRDELESRLTNLELEYEELLDKTIAEEEAGGHMDVSSIIHEVKAKLEAQYAHRREQQVTELEELREMIAQKSEDVQKLNAQLSELKRSNEALSQQVRSAEQLATSRPGVGGLDAVEKEKELERIKKTMAQQLADFDVMKKALMRDLQNRCEKVVALEISLDEAREQYNALLRSSDSKLQQKKMTFLERNLEQLTMVQRQLVEQNAQLKKDFAVAERKLTARNERIVSLEQLLQDAQSKLTTQNQKFEAQLQAVRERLEQARAVKLQPQNAFTFGRIAKPLRGGGAPVVDANGRISMSAAPPPPTMQNHQTNAAAPAAASKRTSWLAGWRTSTS